MTRVEERAREAQEAARREVAWQREDRERRQAEERERLAREEAAWREDRRREDPDRAAQTERQRREEENRRYAAAEARRAVDDKRRVEQEGIMRRQQESDVAARSARREYTGSTPSPAAPPPSTASSPPFRMPEPDPGARTSGRSVYAPQPSRPADPHTFGGLSMPLESPAKYDYDSSTDVEGNKGSWSRHRSAEHTPRKPVSGYAAFALTCCLVLTAAAVRRTRRQSLRRLLHRRRWALSNTLPSCLSTSSSRATFLPCNLCSVLPPCRSPQTLLSSLSPNLTPTASTTISSLHNLRRSPPSSHHTLLTCLFLAHITHLPCPRLRLTHTHNRTPASVDLLPVARGLHRTSLFRIPRSISFITEPMAPPRPSLHRRPHQARLRRV